MDLKSFLEQFQDFLAPKLDTYEQAIYLYVFRHSRMLGLSEVTIGFKSARRKIAQGTGIKRNSMSERSTYDKLKSLEQKGCLNILGTEREGTRISPLLPSEIPGVIPLPSPAQAQNIEEMDFFAVPENRLLIFERENGHCFYCLCTLSESNRLIEHVVSRPEGNNSYRNVVAACHACNNKKRELSAEDLLRQIYRQQGLSGSEFEDRISALRRLRAGEVKPNIKITK